MVGDRLRAMQLPDWVERALQRVEAPATGRVTVEIEWYQGGVTRCTIDTGVRVTPPKMGVGAGR